jgi:hypothetical protein
MPRPKTSGRDRRNSGRKGRKAAAGAGAQGVAAACSQAASSQAPVPPDAAPAEITVESLIRDLDDVLKAAVKRGRPTAAVAAAVAIGRLLHALPDKPGRPPSSHKAGRGPTLPVKFDGNYHDLARRVAFLLGIGKEKKADEPDGADNADGQKRDRHS